MKDNWLTKKATLFKNKRMPVLFAMVTCVAWKPVENKSFIMLLLWRSMAKIEGDRNCDRDQRGPNYRNVLIECLSLLFFIVVIQRTCNTVV